jgi:uncharacterized protein with PQ loop repeat
MDISLPAAAGAVATFVFACSVLPMLGKAVRSKDLASYSRGNLVLANVGNVVYSLYVYDLPAGPIWVLHTFYLSTSALMLTWCLRYGRRPQGPVAEDASATAPAPAPPPATTSPRTSPTHSLTTSLTTHSLTTSLTTQSLTQSLTSPGARHAH